MDTLYIIAGLFIAGIGIGIGLGWFIASCAQAWGSEGNHFKRGK